MLPDYMILCVSAISGIGKVAREQLAMAFALDIPVVVVLTMMDIAPDIKVKHVLDKLSTLIVCAKEALKKRLSAHNQDVQVLLLQFFFATDYSSGGPTLHFNYFAYLGKAPTRQENELTLCCILCSLALKLLIRR